MPIVRLSIMKPLPRMKNTVEELLGELEKVASASEGFIQGFWGSATDRSGELCRIALWETREHADKAVTQEHGMAVRSQIHAAIQPGHIERVFKIKGTPVGIPKPKGAKKTKPNA